MAERYDLQSSVSVIAEGRTFIPLHKTECFLYLYRMIFRRIIYYLLAGLTVVSCARLKKIATIPVNSQQMIVVVTDSVAATNGTLYCYEHNKNNDPWKQSGNTVSVVIGRNGLGTGTGLHQATYLASLPKKQEGDGRSPAGVFTLSYVFGYLPQNQMQELKMPYICIDEKIECIDDTKSMYYNQIISRDTVKKVDWQSSEKMITKGMVYELGVIVDHNSNPIGKGGGSCIFLHNWTDPTKKTSGCTSMDRMDMRRIAFWLDKQKRPVIVLLTRNIYMHVRKPWMLPKLSLREVNR
jgi:L,D-peptidoglycan transpeptidase YkuD (ErfK/YbiS/YcfS/YnhG family)